MCVVSMIGDHFSQKWPQATGGLPGTAFQFPTYPTQAEFDALKKEVLEMKELLKKAKEYDEKNNQPNCEQEKKIEILRKVADLVGVDLGDIFGPKP